MIQLEAHADGVILPVRAMPGAKANGLRGLHRGAVRVAVTQVAEKGKANKALREVICRELGLKKMQVELLSGTTNNQKRFLIRHITADTLQKRLQAVLGED